MASYPNSIYTPRQVENRPGVVYDADKVKVAYAEDKLYSDDEIVAIQEVLGLNPAGVFDDVNDRLDDVDDRIDAIPIGVHYAPDEASDDHYEITVVPVPASYEKGDMYLFLANTANTGEAYLNVNSLGAIPIKKKSSTVLANNDIKASQMVLVAFNYALTLLDSYSEANSNPAGDFPLNNTYHGAGQAFTNPTATQKLSSAKFYMKKVNSPTGNCYAKLYAKTGTVGTDAKPTGAALAVSDVVDVSTLGSAFALKTFTFSGANQIALTAATGYCLVVEYADGTATDYIVVGFDSTSPTHAGNRCWYTTSWSGDATWDCCFYIYGLDERFEMLSQIAN